MVECLTCYRGLQARASPEALRCVLEQDTIVCLVLTSSTLEDRPDITEKMLTGT